jgi:hypothetical protein
MQTSQQTRNTYRAPMLTSLGDHEQLAGIIGEPARKAFWRQFQPIASMDTQHYIDTAMAEADKIIDARIAAGELTVLVDRRIDREMRAKRMREFAKARKVAA